MSDPIWGRYELEPDARAYWRIGSLQLWVLRGKREWRIASHNGLDAQERRTEHAPGRAEADCPPIPKDAGWHRLATGLDNTWLELKPTTADRAVVARPEPTVHLPSNERVVVYVGSPLWVSVWQGEPSRLLASVPTFRPSDTWFGPTPKEGEACYASRTSARLDLEDIVTNPTRTLTRLTVDNQADDELKLERIRIPVPFLALFTGEFGRVWTTPISVVRRPGAGLGEVVADSEPPSEAGGASPLASARRPSSGGGLLETLTTLFG